MPTGLQPTAIPDNHRVHKYVKTARKKSEKRWSSFISDCVTKRESASKRTPLTPWRSNAGAIGNVSTVLPHVQRSISFQLSTPPGTATSRPAALESGAKRRIHDLCVRVSSRPLCSHRKSSHIEPSRNQKIQRLYAPKFIIFCTVMRMLHDQSVDEVFIILLSWAKVKRLSAAGEACAMAWEAVFSI